MFAPVALLDEHFGTVTFENEQSHNAKKGGCQKGKEEGDNIQGYGQHWMDCNWEIGEFSSGLV